MSDKRIVLITGGNTGFGYQVVRALYRSPIAYEIVVGSRTEQKAKDAVAAIQAKTTQSASSLSTIQVDIEQDSSIENAFKSFSAKHDRVDVLINNAGAQFDRQVQEGRMTLRECWNKSWDVNVAGTQVMTHTFAPLLVKSTDPRLIFIASGTSTMTETLDLSSFLNKSPPKGWPKQAQGVPVTAYRSSKAGMNMMMREWTRILREDAVKVFAISPGLMATGLGGNSEMLKKIGAMDPAISAEFVRNVVEGARDKDAGLVIRHDSIQPW